MRNYVAPSSRLEEKHNETMKQRLNKEKKKLKQKEKIEELKHLALFSTSIALAFGLLW